MIIITVYIRKRKDLTKSKSKKPKESKIQNPKESKIQNPNNKTLVCKSKKKKDG